MAKIQRLKINDVGKLLGIAPKNFPAGCLAEFDKMNFNYRQITAAERDRLILSVKQVIDSGRLSVSGENRKGDWHKGWSENLKSFTANRYSLEVLVPKYISHKRPLRLNHSYVMPVSSKFELNFYTIYRNWLFSKYLKDAKAVYEFGCGTGYNLAMIAEIFPDKRLYGLDWVKPSVELANRIGQAQGRNISGLLFNMFEPDFTIKVEPGSVFLTMNSLEQLGRNHEKMVRFFLKKKPILCVNAEPLYELYNEKDLLDSLAMRYHKRRNYLNGYLTRLRKLEAEKKIKIIKIQRVPIGSLYHEGYSLLVWRPL